MNLIALLFVLAAGASIGSFINVIIWRMPRNQSIISPRSYCPKCERKITSLDNIPLLSFLILRGKCRFCRGEIKIDYFLTELLTAAIFIIIYFSKNNIYTELSQLNYLLLSWFFFTILIIQFLLDIKYLWLPSTINYLGILVGLISTLIYSILFKNNLFINHIFAGFIGLGVFMIIYFIGKCIYKKEVIGRGDLKLIFMIGIWMGIEPTLITIYLSFLSAGIVSYLLILFKKINRKSKIAFGPFILISTSIIWIYGIDFLKNFYFNFIERLGFGV